jgi:hypothetical protein
VEGVISPLAEFMDNPAVELNVPPGVPVNVTFWGVDSDAENGVPVYEMVALGTALIVTVEAALVIQVLLAVLRTLSVYVPGIKPEKVSET